jgi:hypothetical protein
MVQQQAGALVVASDPFFYWQRDRLVWLAEHHRVAAIYYLSGFARAGGLMTYGNAFRLVGVYVGRILKAISLPICQWCRRPNSSW